MKKKFTVENLKPELEKFLLSLIEEKGNLTACQVSFGTPEVCRTAAAAINAILEGTGVNAAQELKYDRLPLEASTLSISAGILSIIASAKGQVYEKGEKVKKVSLVSSLWDSFDVMIPDVDIPKLHEEIGKLVAQNAELEAKVGKLEGEVQELKESLKKIVESLKTPENDKEGVPPLSQITSIWKKRWREEEEGTPTVSPPAQKQLKIEEKQSDNLTDNPEQSKISSIYQLLNPST